MDYTQAQYDALNAAIAMGATSVKYADKTVEYRSLEDMMRLKNHMALSLGLVAPDRTGPFRQIGVHSKGL